MSDEPDFESNGPEPDRDDELLALHELGETVREAILRLHAMEDRLGSAPSIADFSLLRGQMRSDLDDWAQGMQERVTALSVEIAETGARIDRFESSIVSLLHSEIAASEGRIVAAAREAAMELREAIEATMTVGAELLRSDSAASTEVLRTEILRAVPSGEAFAAMVGERVDAVLRDLPRAERLAAVLGERIDTAVRDVGDSAGRIEENLRALPERIAGSVRADLEEMLLRERPMGAEPPRVGGPGDEIPLRRESGWFRRRVFRGRSASPVAAFDGPEDPSTTAQAFSAVEIEPSAVPAGPPPLPPPAVPPTPEFAVEPVEVPEEESESVEILPDRIEEAVTPEGSGEAGEREAPEMKEPVFVPSPEIVRALELALELDSTTPLPARAPAKKSAAARTSTKRASIPKKAAPARKTAQSGDAKGSGGVRANARTTRARKP